MYVSCTSWRRYSKLNRLSWISHRVKLFSEIRIISSLCWWIYSRDSLICAWIPWTLVLLSDWVLNFSRCCTGSLSSVNRPGLSPWLFVSLRLLLQPLSMLLVGLYQLYFLVWSTISLLVWIIIYRWLILKIYLLID